MNRVRGRTGGALLGAALLAAAAAVTPAGAQQDEDCRCVDRDGNEIETCTCFVMPRLDDVVANWTSLVRPRLGISVSRSQDPEVDARGAEVRSVLEDGPADEAGIREGDVITSLDGRSLLEPLDEDTEEGFDEDQSLPAQRLLALARDLEPGQQVEIEYLRGGERRTATLEAEDLTRRALALYRDAEPMRDRLRELRRGLDTLAAVPWARMGLPFASGARYGLELVELVPGLAEYFGVQEGVLVTRVDDDSTLGLQPGDVILRIGDRPVDTPERFLRLLSTYENDEVVNLRVRRGGTDNSVQGRVDG
ncbi:MAG TPA: PDZ domain-containing protein [Longimicrobiales bacterium]|nr:PDZ domain-containing protein [Longimicrobiales bacterium]